MRKLEAYVHEKHANLVTLGTNPPDDWLPARGWKKLGDDLFKDAVTGDAYTREGALRVEQARPGPDLEVTVIALLERLTKLHEDKIGPLYPAAGRAKTTAKHGKSEPKPITRPGAEAKPEEVGHSPQ